MMAEKGEEGVWAERAVRAVSRAFPLVEFSTWSGCERLLPQAHACAELINDWGLEFADTARLLNERALAIREKVLGPDHPDVAKSLDYLALLYACRGQYAQAESLYESSLAIREKTLGPEHPDAATSLENYAHRTVPQLLVWAEILSKLRSSEILDRATPN
jgi:tetratricopeptide (TPR) repeat protein